LSSFAKQSGKSLSDVEKLWDKAKEIASDSGRKEDYAYITGVLKNMLKLEYTSESMISEVLSGNSVSDVLEKVMKVSKEPYERAHDRIKSLQDRGVDVIQHTLNRLKATTNADKVGGIFYAAQDFGLIAVIKAAKEKYKQLTGVTLD